MVTNLKKRSIVFVIIFLFIGLSISSNISGLLNNNFPEKKPTYNPQVDYTLAYWKFDECSGNTAYDSSGHDFDGLINGATWITYGSGCALYFDGVNDFIGLDDFSEELGQNKTDDVIYSLYFNTTTTTESLMLSMSDNWNNENPELSIQMCSNGSVLFRIWTNYCGLKIYSKEGYNDGDWHFLKIIFHGSTANPTLEMYVDYSLDQSIEDWLCDIAADDFRKAKIGRRAVVSEKHFVGAIDRLKIIKYPNGNNAPLRPDINGTHFGLPGEELTFNFVSEDIEEDELEYYIDWGDGQIKDWFGPFESGVEVSKTHIFSENGTFNITIRARDFWGKGLWSIHNVSIGNHAPWQPDQPHGPVVGSIDIEYTFTAVTTDEEGDEIYYMWDWGDGTFSDWMGPYNSGIECEASHTWSESGEYDIKVKAKDFLGESSWSPRLTISIVISAVNIDSISGNFLVIKTVIRNIGQWEAKDINWKINLDGGIILSGRNSSGTIQNLGKDEEKSFNSNPIFGFGSTKVKVIVDALDGSHDDAERTGFVFLFFLNIRVGG